MRGQGPGSHGKCSWAWFGDRLFSDRFFAKGIGVSAVIEGDSTLCVSDDLPLLAFACPERVFAWRQGRSVSVAEFLADVGAVATVLPNLACAVNLCEDRYAFLVAFCAVICRGQTNLLPPSRAEQAVNEALAFRDASYALCDVERDGCDHRTVQLPALGRARARHLADLPAISADLVAAVGFTSGSTGSPKPNTKSWAHFRVSSANNSDLLRHALGLDQVTIANIVATVPPQHMYGLELSVLLPLTGPFSVHAARPLFPADVAAALAELPPPRLLVTTPVHLRSLLRSAVTLPALGAIVSATAPLSPELAQTAEMRYCAPVIEVFGSTETCVIAHRRCALEREWSLYAGVDLVARPDGTQVHAAHLPAPVTLHDIVEVLPGRQFRLCGRNADLLEIAGKRASMADLGRRLNDLPGVLDAVVFQLDEADAGGVKRIAALAVAPDRSESELLAELRLAIDPVFLPRPLCLIDRLPRNETGKLPQEALLNALRCARRQ